MRFFATSFLSATLISAGALLSQTPAQIQLPAGQSHFAIYQGDKSVGSADRTIEATSAGYAITSQGKISLSKFSYSFTDVQHLDHALNLVSDQITGAVNGKPVTFNAHSDPTGREFQIEINADGKQSQNAVDRHQHLVLLPDLDPAAYTLLIQVGLQNSPTSWVLIPKEQGLLVPSTYSHDASVRGRFNGAQVDVQHTTVTVGKQNPISVEIYYGRDNQLLEADLPEQNFFVVRDGFKLIDRPKPTPPQGQAPPPQQTAQPQSGAPQQATPQQAAPQYPAPQGGYPQMQPQ